MAPYTIAGCLIAAYQQCGHTRLVNQHVRAECPDPVSMNQVEASVRTFPRSRYCLRADHLPLGNTFFRLFQSFCLNIPMG